MAIDGIKIIDSDFSIDLQQDIFDLYDSNKSDDEIRSYIDTERSKLSESIDIELFVSSCCF